MIKLRLLVMKPIRALFVGGLLVCLLPNAAVAAKLYKWVHDDGSVSYRDSPPPENTLITHQLIDESTTPESDITIVLPPLPPVVVYTVETCDACVQLIDRLSALGVKAEEKSLLDREVQARILQFTDSLIAPTLFIGDKLVGNGIEVNLKAELIAGGYYFPDEAETNASLDIPDDTRPTSE